MLSGMREIVNDVTHVGSYYFSKTWRKVINAKECNQVSPFLYLSSLPVQGGMDKILEEVKQDGELALVVSTTEEKEIKKDRYFLYPIKPEEWNQKGIDHRRLTMKDFQSSVNIDEAVDMVLLIQEYRAQSKSVLIHCKAGRSRSAMLAGSVVAVFNVGEIDSNKSFTSAKLAEEATKILCAKHSLVKVEENVPTMIKIIEKTRALIAEVRVKENVRTRLDLLQKARALLAVKTKQTPKMYISTFIEETTPQQLTLGEKLDEFLANEEFKIALRNTEAYNKLYYYANQVLIDSYKPRDIESDKIKKPYHVEVIEELFKEINTAQDGQWFKTLMHEKGPAKSLVDPVPFWINDTSKNREKRAHLIQNLKDTVEDMICKKLNCTKIEVEDSILMYRADLSPKSRF